MYLFIPNWTLRTSQWANSGYGQVPVPLAKKILTIVCVCVFLVVESAKGPTTIITLPDHFVRWPIHVLSLRVRQGVGITEPMVVLGKLERQCIFPLLNCPWNDTQKIQDTDSGDELPYLRGGYEGRRMDGESNESVFNAYDMSSIGKGYEMCCDSTLRWFGHIVGMLEIELVKRKYIMRRVIARGWPPVKWEDRVLEYVREKNVRIEGCKERM